MPRVTQSTQLRQEKSQQVLPIIWKFLHKLLTPALERFRIIMVIKQDFFIERETNSVMTKQHSSLLFQKLKKKKKKHNFYFPCVYLVQQMGNLDLILLLPLKLPFLHIFLSMTTIRQNKMGKKTSIFFEKKKTVPLLIKINPNRPLGKISFITALRPL